MFTGRKSLGWAMLSVALVAMTAASASAQQGQGQGQGRGRGGFGGMFGGESRLGLAAREQVQSELKLTDEQKTKIRDLAQKTGEQMRGLFGQGQDLSREERAEKFRQATNQAEEQLKAILTPEQQDRLRGIAIQQFGAQMLTRDDVAQKLNLTDEQKKQVRQVLDQAQEQRRQSFQNRQQGQQPDFAALREQMEKQRKETDEKALAVLTPRQKEQWEQMKGKPVDLPRGGFGFGGGRPGQNRDNKNQ